MESSVSVIHHPLGDPLNVGSATTKSSPSTIPPKAAPRRSNRSSRSRRNINNNQCTLSTAKSSNNSTSSSSSQQGASAASTLSEIMQRKQTKQLPRSVRWRLSLGLLTQPTTDSTEKDKILQSIEDLNALKLRFQRSRYDDLEKRHYWKSTPMGIAADETNSSTTENNNVAGSSAANNNGTSHQQNQRSNIESLHHVAPGDDPLSAFMMHDAASSSSKSNGHTSNKTEKQKLFGGSGKKLFGGKQDKSSSSSNTNRQRSRSNGNIGLTDSFNSGSSDGGGDDKDAKACKGSRWADFYSTREVLDVIEKDLVRLPTDHYTIYHEWRIKRRGWEEHREREEKWNRQQEGRDAVERNGSPNAVESECIKDEDEMSIKSHPTPPVAASGGAKQPWSNLSQSWKIGIGKGVKSVENLTTLLQLEEAKDEDTKRQESAEAEIQTSIKERAERISRILFVYAREHPEIGYRQGMHEVLSNILLALEMDLLEQSIILERKRWRKDSLSFSLQAKDNNAGGAMAGVCPSSGKIVVVRLLDPDYILHDAFNLFECIMTSLAPAYDAIPAGDEMAASMPEEATSERGESPMELMTSSIVSKIRFVARDEELFSHVLYMPVPPQLYFAKWIRLMFGREVAGGMKSVMTLWGAFFDLASARASANEDISITTALLDVLKTAAASMILLIRDLLLAPTIAPDGTMTGEPDPNVGIGYLMNYPPLHDIGTLVETISELLSREQKMSNQYQVSKERKLSKQFLPSESYKISSIMEHPLEASAESKDQSILSSPNKADLHLPFPEIKEGVHGNVNGHNDFLPSRQGDELPQVFRTGGKSHHVQPPKHHHDVAESIGHLAEGLMDFGSKTASAAIASIQKQYEVRSKQMVDHPLQSNDTPTTDECKNDYIISYRPQRRSLWTQSLADEQVYIPTDKEVQSPISDVNTIKQPMGLGDKQGFDAKKEEKEESDVEVDSIEGLDDDSITSKLSSIISDPVHKSPKELATMLEKSVATLMKHFNERLTAEADSSMRGGEEVLGNSVNSQSMLPGEIWDAMADIDLVRKELLTQAALSSQDHARSTSSLRSSGNSGSRRRGKRRGSDKRQSWRL